MKTTLFLANAGDVRGQQPKHFWLAHSIRSEMTGLETRAKGPDDPNYPVAAIYAGPRGRDEKLALVHFLGDYDKDGKRIHFAVVDLTESEIVLWAARNFSRGNGDILQEMHCA